MITVNCRFAHSFKIMRIPQSIIPVRDPPQPVTVLRSGRADILEVPYIRCLNGQAPKAYELWALADDVVSRGSPVRKVQASFRVQGRYFSKFLLQFATIPDPFLGSQSSC